MAPALTELDKDVLGLIECHLLEGLPHQDFNGPRVPVLRGLCAQQARLWGTVRTAVPEAQSAGWDRGMFLCCLLDHVFSSAAVPALCVSTAGVSCLPCP